jgi:hypothetical protein
MQHGLASIANIFGSPQGIIRSFANLMAPTRYANAAEVQGIPANVGVDQWGWSTAEQAKLDTNPQFSLPNLVQTVEPQLDTMNNDYQDCYTYVLQSDRPSKCTKDYLETDRAFMWRAYMSESYAADHLTGSI